MTEEEQPEGALVVGTSTGAAPLDARAAEAYTTYVSHLHGCLPCQDGDDCAPGIRLREAWKTARNTSLRAHRPAHPATT